MVQSLVAVVVPSLRVALKALVPEFRLELSIVKILVLDPIGEPLRVQVTPHATELGTATN